MAGVWCLVLLFGTLVAPLCECAAKFQDPRCSTDIPCFDLSVMANMALRASKDVIAADGENILLKHNTFDKIRKKKHLHSCVLLKILDLFEHVLDSTEKKLTDHDRLEIDPHEALIPIMEHLRNCVYETKHGCDKLYKKAETASTLKVSESKMKPNQAAILQIQKLKNAREKLHEVNIQNRIMDELKSLHLYIPGKGFRKTEDV